MSLLAEQLLRSFFGKQRRHNSTESASLGSAAWACGPAPWSGANLHHLRSETQQLARSHVNRHRPLLCCPVVSGLGVHTKSPCCLCVVRKERLNERGIH